MPLSHTAVGIIAGVSTTLQVANTVNTPACVAPRRLVFFLHYQEVAIGLRNPYWGQHPTAVSPSAKGNPPAARRLLQCMLAKS